MIVCAQGYYGIFHLAEYSLLLGVKLKNVPPEVGSRQQVLAKYELPARGLTAMLELQKTASGHS